MPSYTMRNWIPTKREQMREQSALATTWKHRIDTLFGAIYSRSHILAFVGAKTGIGYCYSMIEH